MDIKEAIADIEVLQAILILEYHNKNYLDRALNSSPKLMNETQRELLADALRNLSGKAK